VKADDVNVVDVSVVELEFLGAFCRAYLQPQGETSKALVADFSANLMRDLNIAPNKRLLIALPPEVLRVFPATGLA
jgi:iron(III) transport system ATP-binding protein